MKTPEAGARGSCNSMRCLKIQTKKEDAKTCSHSSIRCQRGNDNFLLGRRGVSQLISWRIIPKTFTCYTAECLASRWGGREASASSCLDILTHSTWGNYQSRTVENTHIWFKTRFSHNFHRRRRSAACLWSSCSLYTRWTEKMWQQLGASLRSGTLPDMCWNPAPDSSSIRVGMRWISPNLNSRHHTQWGQTKLYNMVTSPSAGVGAYSNYYTTNRVPHILVYSCQSNQISIDTYYL